MSNSKSIATLTTLEPRAPFSTSKEQLDAALVSAPGAMNYVPPVEAPPPPLPPDEAEELLEKYNENQRSLDALINAERQWKREAAAITENPDGATEEQLERLSRLEGELLSAPRKVKLLQRKKNHILRELALEQGIRYYKLQQAAHTVFQERRDKVIQFLLPKMERDDLAAYEAAMQFPAVKKLADLVDSFQYVDSLHPEIGVSQLIRIQKEITAEIRKLK